MHWDSITWNHDAFWNSGTIWSSNKASVMMWSGTEVAACTIEARESTLSSIPSDFRTATKVFFVVGVPFVIRPIVCLAAYITISFAEGEPLLPKSIRVGNRSAICSEGRAEKRFCMSCRKLSHLTMSNSGTSSATCPSKPLVWCFIIGMMARCKNGVTRDSSFTH